MTRRTPPKRFSAADLGPALAAGGGTALLCAFFLLASRAKMPSDPARGNAPGPASASPLAGVTVVLDPGHGGADPGTTAGPLSEASLTYRTASELAAALEFSGAKVVYTVQSRCLDPRLAAAEPPLTPPDDATLTATGEPLRARRSPRPLWLRAETARTVWQSAHADRNAERDIFFLSLHFDASSVPGVHGGVVCVDRRMPAVPRLASALAAQMAADNLGRTEDFHGIAGLSGRELGVLDPAYNPIPERALLEIATLSDPQDAIEAGDPAWRGEIVRRITEAITQAHKELSQ